MPEMSGAQALVGSLARNGVKVVFALPGVQIMDAFDAFYHRKVRVVRVVSCFTEIFLGLFGQNTRLGEVLNSP